MTRAVPDPLELGAPPQSGDTMFAPVRSQTAFEETVERLGTAIRLGLLEPGARLPAERDLCAKLGISRSTLRQALTALRQSGHLHAVRGRGGGTFVVERPPLAVTPTEELLTGWRDACDARLVIEVGVAMLAADRASEESIAGLQELVDEMDVVLEDFDVRRDFNNYRQLDVRFHIGLAESCGSVRVAGAMTQIQGNMTDLISYIAHPIPVLASSNAQHAKLLQALRRGDGPRAVRIMAEHCRSTEHVLAGLLPPREIATSET